MSDLTEQERRDFWQAMREWNDSPPFKFDRFAESNEILYAAVARIRDEAVAVALREASDRVEADRLVQRDVGYLPLGRILRIVDPGRRADRIEGDSR